MARRARQHGFTLLELVLVMVIALTAMAIAAPSLRGWARGGELKSACEEFLAVTRYARSQAMSTARTYKLQIDANAGIYQLTMQRGMEYVEVPGRFGAVFRLPKGARMELSKAVSDVNSEQDAEPNLYFYPTGRSQAAVLKISDALGYVMEIRCDSPAETFHLAGLSRN